MRETWTLRPKTTLSGLYQLLEAYYEDVKAVWEERFQKTYGFWRGFIDTVVARHLDGGMEENGFARLKCDACGSAHLQLQTKGLPARCGLPFDPTGQSASSRTER